MSFTIVECSQDWPLKTMGLDYFIINDHFKLDYLCQTLLIGFRQSEIFNLGKLTSNFGEVVH